MSERDLLQRLRDLDRPIEPSQTFRDELWVLLESERARDREDPGTSSGTKIDPVETVARPAPARHGRLWVAAAVFIGVIALGLGTWWLASGFDQTAETTPSTVDTVVPTTMGGATVTDAEVRLPDGLYPIGASFTEDRVWVLASHAVPEPGQRPDAEGTLLGLDRNTRETVVEVVLSDRPTRVVADDDAVWVTHWPAGPVSRVDPSSGEVVATVALELPFDFGGLQGERDFLPYELVLGHGSVWVSTARGAVARIDQDTNQVEEIYVFEGRKLGAEMAVGPDGVWVTGDVAGLFHISADTGEITHVGLEVLDHSASGVFVPGEEQGDSVFVSGDPLERNEDGGFRRSDGSYFGTDRSVVSRLDPETYEVLGSTDFDRPVLHLGWVNAFVGALDEEGVFTHLSSIPRLGSQVNETTWGGNDIFTVSRESWELDTAGGRLARIDETGPAGVQLPFEIDDRFERRPIAEQFVVSDDWVELDPGPLEPQWPAVMTWTGEEIVGGGVAYRPDTGVWREISPGPLRGGHEQVWTGEELLVWTFEQAAAWQPESNTWRTIELWPLSPSFYPGAAWTGEGILDGFAGLLVDPSDGSSTPIADPPEPHERASVVWVDGYLVFVTGEGAYHLATDRWIEMPESGLTPLATSGVALGDTMIAVDYEMHAARFDPVTNEWTSLPELPLRFSECSPKVHAAGDRPIAEHCSGMVAWDQDEGQWIPIAYPIADTATAVITAGDRLFVWGERFFEFVGDLENPARLAIGTSIFDRPDDWAVRSVTVEGGIVVEVESSDGENCTINAIHSDAEGVLTSYIVAEPVLTEVQPYVGGEPTSALEVENGLIDDRFHVVWATGTTDVIDLACDSRDAAEQLAPRIWSPFQ